MFPSPGGADGLGNGGGALGIGTLSGIGGASGCTFGGGVSGAVSGGATSGATVLCGAMLIIFGENDAPLRRKLTPVI